MLVQISYRLLPSPVPAAEGEVSSLTSLGHLAFPPAAATKTALPLSHRPRDLHVNFCSQGLHESLVLV